nr:hypothetical protein [Tanacetum cinerariifolium]
MQNFISSSDLLCYNIVLKGNSAKSMTTDKDGNLKIRPPFTAEEHQQKFKEFIISKEEGLDKGYDKMQKILSQMNTLKIKPEPEDINMKFIRGLPPSWSGIALILKIKRGLEYFSFDDMYNKLKFLEIDTKGYSLSPSTLSNAAFVNQQLVYKDIDQMNKEEFEEYDLKHQIAMLSIKIKSDADSEGEVVSADDVIPASVFVPAGTIAAAVVSTQSETEFAFMGLSTEAKWNNSGINLYKLIDSSMSVRTKRGLGLDKYIRKGELGIDDSKVSIFYTNSDDLEGKPIYNSDRSLEPSTNDLKMCDSSVECSRPNHSDHDSTSSVHAPASESRDTIVIDCDKQEDLPIVCSIETDVKSSRSLCNKFGSFNKESHFRKHKSVASKSCYVCGSYLHLIKDCDFHEQTFAKRNAEGKGILGKRPTGKPVNQNRPNLVSASLPNHVSAGQQNTVFAGQPNPVSAGQQNTVSAGQPNQVSAGQLEKAKDRGIVDSGCSRSMSGNKDKLEDFEDFDGGEVTFRGSTGKISGKGTIKTKNLKFKNVLYVEEL